MDAIIINSWGKNNGIILWFVSIVFKVYIPSNGRWWRNPCHYQIPTKCTDMLWNEVADNFIEECVRWKIKIDVWKSVKFKWTNHDWIYPQDEARATMSNEKTTLQPDLRKILAISHFEYAYA